MNIGIVGKIKNGTPSNSFGIGDDYYDFFGQFGSVFVMPTPIGEKEIKRYVNFTDMLVLPGGADVNYIRYGNGRLNSKVSNSDQFLEYFEKYALSYFIESKKPIVGICRGIQTLNVYFGGTLNQDIVHPYSQYADELNGHAVLLCDESGKTINNKPIFKVNSLHHQSIKDLATDLIPVLISDDEEIEAVKHRTLPIFAVQFHPEILNEYNECVIWAANRIKELIK